MRRHAADHTGNILLAVYSHTLRRHEPKVQTAGISHPEKSLFCDGSYQKANLIHVRIQQHVGLSGLTLSQCAEDVPLPLFCAVTIWREQRQHRISDIFFAAGHTGCRSQLTEQIHPIHTQCSSFTRFL